MDPALLLLPIGVRAENPSFGSYPTSHHIALPETATVTVSNGSGTPTVLMDPNPPRADFASTAGGNPTV